MWASRSVCVSRHECECEWVWTWVSRRECEHEWAPVRANMNVIMNASVKPGRSDCEWVEVSVHLYGRPVLPEFNNGLACTKGNECIYIFGCILQSGTRANWRFSCTSCKASNLDILKVKHKKAHGQRKYYVTRAVYSSSACVFAPYFQYILYQEGWIFTLIKPWGHHIVRIVICHQVII